MATQSTGLEGTTNTQGNNGSYSNSAGNVFLADGTQVYSSGKTAEQMNPPTDLYTGALNGYQPYSQSTPSPVTDATTVPNSSLQPSTPITVPPVQTFDPLTGVVASTNTDLNNAMVGDSSAASNKDTAINDYKTLSNQLLGKSAEQLALEQSLGIPGMNTQLNDLQNISRQKNIEYNMAPEMIHTNGLTTAFQFDKQVSSQRHELAIDIMLNNSNIQALQGNIALAQQTADRAIKAKYDPIEQKIQTQKDLIDYAYKDMTAADKKLADAKTAQLDALQKQVDDKKAKETAINNVALEAAKNGASYDTLTAIRNTTSVGDAISTAGASLASSQNEWHTLGDGAVLIDKNTGKIIKSYLAPSSSPVPTNASDTTKALTSLAPLVSGFSSVNAQKVFTSSINKLAQKTGNEKAIAEKLIGTAIDNITDPNERKTVTGDFQMSQQVTRIQGLLDEYTKNGGQTNFIVGKAEGGYQFTGNTTNPALANIGVQIANSLDELARTRTGAVVSPSEEKMFQKLLPGIGKSPELNTAITTGLKTSMMANVENALKYSVTSDGLSIIKSTLPDLFGDYRSSDPDVQLKNLYSANPQNKSAIDKIMAENPTWTSQDIINIFTQQ